MNKNNRKKKGLSKRVLALMLCCFCLLATVPISAFALETGETQITEERISEQQSESTSEALLPLSSETSESQTETDTQQNTSDEVIEPIIENETDTASGDETGAEAEIEENAETEADTEIVTETYSDIEAEDGTQTNTETETESKDNNTEKLSFYDQLMAAESCQEIFNLMMSDTDACLLMSAEELTQLKEKVNSMEDDGYQVDVLDTIVYLEGQLGGCTCGVVEGEEHDTSCPMYEISTYAEQLNQSYWKNTINVYYDTVNNVNYGSAASNNGVGVTSVKLAGTAVAYGNAGTTSWSGGTTLATYYPSATTSNETTASLSIAASEGYYVTGVVVACAPKPGSQLSPFKCSTWSSGYAYQETFNLSQSTYSNGVYTLTKDLSSKAFCHDSNSKGTGNYFILILVAPVPTPLYVEYNYGNVESFLTVDSNSAFYNPTWTVKSSSNNYGTGSVYTNDTQFAYGYENNDTSVIASWTHYANTISDAALAEAANVGYYFTGWSVIWYNECNISEADNTYRDSYTMSFSDEYMTGSYQSGASVQLPTHVRLVAQWAPISLKMTKTVSGLSSITEFTSTSQTYTLQLQNQQNGEYVTLQTKDYTITGDGTLTYTFAASGADVTQIITPGTYKVVETGSYDLTGSVDNAYCTTTYPVQTVEVTANGTVQELQVLNTYSSTPATYDLTVQKTVSGNMYDANKEFAFTVTYGDETATFNLKKDGTYTIENIPVGAAVAVTESPDGYTYSFVSITEGVAKEDTTNGVSFIMPAQDVTVVINNDKTVTVDTGILLDTLPYILILGVVAVGAVLLIKKRRNRDDD